MNPVPASEVENARHSYLERVGQVRETIVVTRYGKPVAQLSPVDEPVSGRIFGCLAGTVTVRGDIVAPIGGAWEADA